MKFRIKSEVSARDLAKIFDSRVWDEFSAEVGRIPRTGR
jgi:hypothetical protein